MPRQITITVYKFDELSPSAQLIALEKFSTINVDHQWYDYLYEDAQVIGLEIIGFDLERRSIETKLIKPLAEVIKLIKANHGKACDTFKTALQFSTPIARRELLKQRLDGNSSSFERSFRVALAKDYLKLLQSEYDYQTSAEAITETIRANDYDFTIDGKLFILDL